MNPKNILVTGASSGFGNLICKELLHEGHRVFATMREVKGRNAEAAAELEGFAQDAKGAVETLELDVTDEDSVRSAVGLALKQAGHLDVAVNNAGIGTGGFAEAFTPDQWQQLFDVNVLGVQRVNRAVLPSMRERGSGLLVHVSSIMGRIVIPFAAPYTASKWALEGMVESYRYELAKTGVDVVLVEPGGFGTSFADRMLAPADEARVASYGELAGVPEKIWEGMMEQLQSDEAPDPALVARAVAELVRTPAGQRPLRTVVDPFMGGEAPEKLNDGLAAAQAELMKQFGMADWLGVGRG